MIRCVHVYVCACAHITYSSNVWTVLGFVENWTQSHMCTQREDEQSCEKMFKCCVCYLELMFLHRIQRESCTLFTLCMSLILFQRNVMHCFQLIPHSSFTLHVLVGISVLFLMISIICTLWITWMYNFQANIQQLTYNVRRFWSILPFNLPLLPIHSKNNDRVILYEFTNDSLHTQKCTYRRSDQQI